MPAFWAFCNWYQPCCIVLRALYTGLRNNNPVHLAGIRMKFIVAEFEGYLQTDFHARQHAGRFAPIAILTGVPGIAALINFYSFLPRLLPGTICAGLLRIVLMQKQPVIHTTRFIFFIQKIFACCSKKQPAICNNTYYSMRQYPERRLR
jgi:hypothetical protein